MKKLTPEQINSLTYFWLEKLDLESYYAFEELKPQIEVEYPELIIAWYSYKNAIEKMYDVIYSMPVYYS